LAKWARGAHFFYEGSMTSVYEKERVLFREVAERIERGIPGTEVLAVEMTGPEALCVYIDHPQGVDHALCERVTLLLDTYRRDYGIDVSSPGTERPLRKPAHFRRALGRRVSVRTAYEIGGRKRFRGQLLAATDEGISLGAQSGEATEIPYEAIVRGNLIDGGWER
jgi:ribosome maturation factor RimP